MNLSSWTDQSRERRQRQVASAIQRELSSLLRGLRDPRLGFVTVTEVKVSANLKQAQLYVSVLGEEEERHNTMAVLEGAEGFIRHELASRLKLRFMPEIEFVPDLTLERAARLEALLDQIRENTPTGSEDETQR
jgi:ribosome-binding factor A